MRAQWTDFFMVCNMATKKSGFPEKPVEKIRFEIFKKLSCLHFLAKFNEFWILYSPCKGVRKSLLAFFRTGSSGSGNPVYVFYSAMYLCVLYEGFSRLLISTFVFSSIQRCCSSVFLIFSVQKKLSLILFCVFLVFSVNLYNLYF